jgi:hypothetical protein
MASTVSRCISGHTPQPGGTPDKSGARKLYHALRAAFPDFHATIHWQTADGDVVTTSKKYHGTHKGSLLGIPATDRKAASRRDAGVAGVERIGVGNVVLIPVAAPDHPLERGRKVRAPHANIFNWC